MENDLDMRFSCELSMGAGKDEINHTGCTKTKRSKVPRRGLFLFYLFWIIGLRLAASNLLRVKLKLKCYF